MYTKLYNFLLMHVAINGRHTGNHDYAHAAYFHVKEIPICIGESLSMQY